jgi:hypothetical protein
MTDTPSSRPAEPNAPDPAAPHPPVTQPGDQPHGDADLAAVPAQAAARGRATESAPPAVTSLPHLPPAGPVQGSSPARLAPPMTFPAPVAGWEWSGSWVPRPGVVPLRPLAFSELMSASFAVVRRQWRSVLVLFGCTALVTQIAVSTANWFAPGRNSTATLHFNSTAGGSELLHQELQALKSLGASFAVSLPFTIFAAVLAGALIAPGVSRAVLGRTAAFGEVWPEIRSRLPKALGLATTVALGLSVVGGVFLAPAVIADLAGASDQTVITLGLLTVPGGLIFLWLYVSLLLAAPALMLEGHDLRTAMARSLRLVRGAWWRVFGQMFLATLVVDLAVGLITSPLAFGLAAEGSDTASVGLYIVAALLGVLSSLASLPVTSTFTALLYVDQRIRREALDLELAAAAGVTGYGH